MSELGSLLSALQLADSFFPSGRYTLSAGLECFAAASLLRDAGDLEALLRDYMTFAVGASDAVAAAAGARAATKGDLPTVMAIDELLFALKLPAESSMSSVRTGRQLLATAGRLSDDPVLAAYGRRVTDGEAPGNHAVAFGVLAAAWRLSPPQAAAAELHAALTGLLGAALRLTRVDHNDAQDILRRLQPLLSDVAVSAAATEYHEMSAFAPTIEIMQMKHETSHLRLFAS